MTDLELKAIEAIFKSDYAWGSGVEGIDVVGAPVWTFSVVDALPGSKASRGGVIASLSKKGFITFQSYDAKDDCITLQISGYKAYKAAGGVIPCSEEN